MYVHPEGTNTGMANEGQFTWQPVGVGCCPKTCLHSGLQFGQFLHPGGTDAVIQLRVGRDDVSPLSSVFDDAWREKKNKTRTRKFDRKSHSIFLWNQFLSFFYVVDLSLQFVENTNDDVHIS